MSCQHYHRIDSIEDETNLLKRIVHLQTQIRASRERKRLSDNSESETYSKIFEPITKSMKSLQAAVVSGSSSSLGKGKTSLRQHSTTTPPPPSPPALSSPSTNDDNDDDEEEEEEEEKENAEKNAERNAEDERGLQTEIKNDNLQSTTTTSAENIVKHIPKGRRDDGIFGLNWAKKTIGDQTFQINGQNLRVRTGDQQWQMFHISNDEVWKMLFMQNPTDRVSIKTADGELTPAAKQYREIVQNLKLVEHAQTNKNLKYMNRKKYKDIISIAGRGFMYSLQQPSSFKKRRRSVGGSGMENSTAEIEGKKREKFSQFHPSTIVIPSDKNGLLCALVKAMAELKAGNTSMRNLVVPLLAEAKRRGILPREYDNTVKDMNWVYA